MIKIDNKKSDREIALEQGADCRPSEGEADSSLEVLEPCDVTQLQMKQPLAEEQYDGICYRYHHDNGQVGSVHLGGKCSDQYDQQGCRPGPYVVQHWEVKLGVAGEIFREEGVHDVGGQNVKHHQTQRKGTVGLRIHTCRAMSQYAK